jgi:outer membrane protein OmpA-like peptidoglycan-associated protein
MRTRAKRSQTAVNPVAFAGSGGPAAAAPANAPQPDFQDPNRFQAVHQAMRVDGPKQPQPSGGTGPAKAKKPWKEPSAPGKKDGTAHALFTEAFQFLDLRNFNKPTPNNTNEADLDTDAVKANDRVTNHYGQITSKLSDAAVQKAVGIFKPATVKGDMEYLNAWMDNVIDQLAKGTVKTHHIDQKSPTYRAAIEKLIKSKTVGPKILVLATGQSAFTRGPKDKPREREVFVHKKVNPAERVTTLIHELIHFYAHKTYGKWVEKSKNERHYNEGLTEWLARRVMTASELSGRSNYQDRVDTVNKQIAAHVPEDGIARAFFGGEVWRFETRSDEARASFKAATGIEEGASADVEREASRTGAGLVQTVEPRKHYRFLNLGFAESQPKSEHEATFKDVKAQTFDKDSSLKFRFVGHASSPGSEAANREVARKRSVAFYRMARREGVPRNRLADAARPPHFGESKPTATEEDAITRAMNRRVEMFLVKGTGP